MIRIGYFRKRGRWFRRIVGKESIGSLDGSETVEPCDIEEFLESCERFRATLRKIDKQRKRKRVDVLA